MLRSVAVAAGVLLLAGCGRFSAGFGSNEPTSVALQITPAAPRAVFGEVINFSGTGGQPPFAYNCDRGSIDADSGRYVAPPDGVWDVVTVTDAAGSTANTGLSLTDPMLVEAPGAVSAGQTISIGVSGAYEPYSFEISSGGGTVDDSGVFVAPPTEDEVTLVVSDSATHSEELEIRVYPPILTTEEDLIDTDSFSWVELDVNWDTNTAYMASREPGFCVDIVDFSDAQNPVIAARMGPGETLATTSATCLGLQLFAGGDRLLLASGNTAEVWDLTLDPIARAATYDVGSELHRVGAIEEGDPATIHLSIRGGYQALSYTEGPPTLTPGATWTGGTNYNDGVLAQGLFVTGGWLTWRPLEVLDPGTQTVVLSVPMDDSGVDQYSFWSAATSADETLVFLGGWVTAFLRYESATGEFVVVRRFDNDSVYRDAQFVETDGTVYVYAIQSHYHLDVYDFTDANDPTLVYRTQIGDSTELYGLRVDLANSRIVVVSNRGMFYVVDMDNMVPAEQQWPTF